MLCYNHASCKYWTWRKDYPNNGSTQYCHLKDANSGLSYSEGVISGGKNCFAPRGKDADPYQCFFHLTKTKNIHSFDIHYRQESE